MIDGAHIDGSQVKKQDGRAKNGGARPGAGRKPGSMSRVSRELQTKYLNDGKESPLDYMIRVMRDKRADSGRRDDMAKAAAPYLFHKLASVELTNDPDDEDGLKFTVIKRVIVPAKK